MYTYSIEFNQSNENFEKTLEDHSHDNWHEFEWTNPSIEVPLLQNNDNNNIITMEKSQIPIVFCQKVSDRNIFSRCVSWFEFLKGSCDISTKKLILSLNISEECIHER